MRWDWDHILTFDPLTALAKVHCPVLGVFGELDPLTPALRTTENMRRVLKEADHQDFLVRNPRYPYIVINDLPKIGELKRVFPEVYRTTPVLVSGSR